MKNLFDGLINDDREPDDPKNPPQITVDWDLFHDLEEVLGVQGTRMVATRVRKVLATLVRRAKKGEVNLNLDPPPPPPIRETHEKSLHLLKTGLGMAHKAIHEMEQHDNKAEDQ